MTKEGKNRQTREIGLTHYSFSYKPDLPLPSMVAELVIEKLEKIVSENDMETPVEFKADGRTGSVVIKKMASECLWRT